MAPDGKEREVYKHLSSFFSFWFERTVCIENGAECLVILLWTTDIWAKGNLAPCLALPAMTDPCLYGSAELMMFHQWLWWQDRDQVRPRLRRVPESFYGGVGGLGVREEQGTQLQATWQVRSLRKGRVTHGKYLCGKLREQLLNEFAVCQALDWCESTTWFLISSSACIVTIHEGITVKYPETKRHVWDFVATGVKVRGKFG